MASSAAAIICTPAFSSGMGIKRLGLRCENMQQEVSSPYHETRKLQDKVCMMISYEDMAQGDTYPL